MRRTTTHSRLSVGLAGASTGRASGRLPAVAKRGTDKADSIVATLTACIADLRAASFGETADMLMMVRLDLLARVHGVSDAELDGLIALAATSRTTD